MDLAQAARKAAVKEEKLKSWEDGTEQPTIKQLRTLGEIYRRPLAVFFLPDPPRDFQVQNLKDFRRLAAGAAGGFSPELRFEIRRALFRREVALELFQNIGAAAQPFRLRADLSEDPELAGARVRNALGITLDRQRQWQAQGYDAFNEVRDAVEAQGALVFQAAVPLEEMRGLAIYLEPLPLVLVSSKENYMAPRLFTLLHEVCHLMLHCSAISDGAEDGLKGEAQRVEAFANHVAGAALLPMDCLLAEPEVAGIQRGTEWNDTQIERVAKRYRVSRETVLRRLLIAGRVTGEDYRSASSRWRQAFAALPPKKAEGAPQVHVVELSRVGRVFPRLVLQNYYQEKITGPDVAEYLNLKLKHLPKIEAELRGRRAAVTA
jgi:Zn-dependent peptidase ImmA (M78 family)